MIILALLLERVITVTKPLKAALILSPKRALIITFILIVLLAMFNIPRLFPTNAEKVDSKECFPHVGLIFSIITVFVSGVLPLFGILIMNLIILCAVKSSKVITNKQQKNRGAQKRSKLFMVSQSQGKPTTSTSVNKPTADGTNSGMKQTLCDVIPARNVEGVDVQGRRMSRTQKQLTTMTVVMTTAFFLCIMPFYVHTTVVIYFHNFRIFRCDINAWLIAILWWGSALAHCLNALNSAINFFIYVMTGSKFRADLMTLLHLK